LIVEVPCPCQAGRVAKEAGSDEPGEAAHPACG
jgi:hypothetical protein